MENLYKGIYNLPKSCTPGEDGDILDNLAKGALAEHSLKTSATIKKAIDLFEGNSGCLLSSPKDIVWVRHHGERSKTLTHKLTGTPIIKLYDQAFDQKGETELTISQQYVIFFEDTDDNTG
jgi:hypothetical protein